VVNLLLIYNSITWQERKGKRREEEKERKNERQVKCREKADRKGRTKAKILTFSNKVRSPRLRVYTVVDISISFFLISASVKCSLIA
jgi:hypothetical protein